MFEAPEDTFTLSCLVIFLFLSGMLRWGIQVKKAAEEFAAKQVGGGWGLSS